MYAEYRNAKAEMKEFQLAQEIARTFLKEEKKRAGYAERKNRK